MRPNSFYETAARNARRQLRRSVTGSLIAGALGIPLGAFLGNLSAALLLGDFHWVDDFLFGWQHLSANGAAWVGAFAGWGVGSLVGLTVAKPCPMLRLRIALCIGAAGGAAVAPFVFDAAAYWLGIADTQEAYTLLAVRLLGLGVGSGCLLVGILSLLLTLIRDRWEWMHRWDSSLEEVWT